jgi:radical SAM superfamily enzyme with C-terminal helix-hairpin-helix motif
MVKKVPGRNGGTLHVLEKGETANPSGGQKGKRLSTIINSMLDRELAVDETDQSFFGDDKKASAAHILAVKLIAKAIKAGDVSAMKEILDRVDGKVPNENNNKNENEHTLKDIDVLMAEIDGRTSIIDPVVN